MTTITGKQLREAEAATATLDGGNSTASQRIAAVLESVHGKGVKYDKEALNMLGLDLEAQERSRHKGFRGQVSDIEPRPQVAPEFTVPPLPPASAQAAVDGLPTGETQDAEIARAKTEAGDKSMTGASDRLTGPAADLTPSSPKPKAPKLSDPATGEAK